MAANADFSPARARMEAARLPDIVIRTFAHYFEQLAAGHKGLLPESAIEPVGALPDTADITPKQAATGDEALRQTVMVKLNGGLGTGMGLDRAKSLLQIKDGLSCLDIVARQAVGAGIPLILMNSFSTREDSLAALAAYPELVGDLPLDFMQHKVPKLRAADLAPAEWPADPALAWCPPGHGDLYTALVTSGLLDRLLALGYRTAFVSNSDNLGAVVDPAILGYFVARDLPFLMEVAERAEADRKGGHLARRPDGQLLLRESAQCPPADAAAFQDLERHRFFNTNNLWLNLLVLREVMDRREGILGLPMICNEKTVDPRDPDSPAVWQLETAMGSAIEVFAGAEALRVPKSRFAPIKKTNDLLDVRSDNYVLNDAFQVLANPARQLPRAVIDLDPAFFGFVDQFDARFPRGLPSLLECERLVVRGDIKFGRDVVCRGVVTLNNEYPGQLTVPDGCQLTGSWPL